MLDWFKSRTIWGGIIMFLASLAKQQGWAEFSEADIQVIADKVVIIANAIGFIFVIWGRARAAKPLLKSSKLTLRSDAVLLILLAILLSGCAPNTDKGPMAMLLACRSYSGTLEALTTLLAEGALSDREIMAIEDVRPAASAACSGNEPESSVDVVTKAVRALLEIEFAAKGRL